jgi:hypothetical protein
MANRLQTAALPPPHEILARVFNDPDRVKRLARLNGVSDNHADKWLRGGESSSPSNLERLCKEIFLATRFDVRGAGVIADYVREFYLSLVEMSAEPYAGEHERVVDGTGLLREATEAVIALQTSQPTPEALKELVELRDAADAAITRLSVTQEGRP